MCTRSLLSVGLLLVGMAAFADDAPEKLGYQTLVDDVQGGRVKSVEISSGIGSSNDITVTALKGDQEVTYVVQRPYRAAEDPVFLDFLKKSQVEYKLVEKKDVENDFFPFAFLGLGSAVVMLGIPIAMLVLLIISVVRIGRVYESIKSLEFFLKVQFAVTEGQRLPPMSQGAAPQGPAAGLPNQPHA